MPGCPLSHTRPCVHAHLLSHTLFHPWYTCNSSLLLLACTHFFLTQNYKAAVPPHVDLVRPHLKEGPQLTNLYCSDQLCYHR